MENKNPTRREFLGASATAITGLAIVPGASSAALQKSESAFPKRDNEGSNGVDLVSLTLSEAAGRIRRKQISPVELTQASLDRIAMRSPARVARGAANPRSTLSRKLRMPIPPRTAVRPFSRFRQPVPALLAPA